MHDAHCCSGFLYRSLMRVAGGLIEPPGILSRLLGIERDLNRNAGCLIWIPFVATPVILMLFF